MKISVLMGNIFAQSNGFYFHVYLDYNKWHEKCAVWKTKQRSHTLFYEQVFLFCAILFFLFCAYLTHLLSYKVLLFLHDLSCVNIKADCILQINNVLDLKIWLYQRITAQNVIIITFVVFLYSILMNENHIWCAWQTYLTLLFYCL